MDIGIDDLDFADGQGGTQEESIEQQNFGADTNFEKPWLGENTQETDQNGTYTEINNAPDEKDDVITNLLRAKGIEDPNQIKFEDEDGNIQARPWNQLTKEEQFNILNDTTPTATDDLDDDEISLINQLRLSRMSPDEFVQRTMQEGAQQFAQTIPNEPSYAVDDLSDDELFVYDLKARANDITDEEVATALQQAKDNPTLYQKQVDGMRLEYKQLEEDQNAQQQAVQEQEQLEQQQAFQQNILQSIVNMDSIGSLDVSLDDDDKEEIADFILGRDQAGNSYLGKALNDPDTLTRMAWFALRGADALDNIQEYFSKQITEVRKQAYAKGVEDARNGTPHVVIQPTNKQQQQQPITAFAENKYKSVDDLD